MNIITAIVEYLDQQHAIETLTAERDAALARVEALEAEMVQVRTRSDFYFDMVCANDAWARARREREVRSGR